jgi:hypothetical protein
VSQTLALLTAPVSVQRMITNGEVSPTLAMQIVREEGSAAEKVLRDGLAASGGDKVTPASVGKPNIKTLIRDLLDYADIDDSAEDCCIIKTPMEKWEALKEALKY